MKKLILLAALAVCAACADKGYEKNAAVLCPIAPLVKRVAVVPFDVPIGGRFGLYAEGKIHEGSTEKLTTFTETELQSYKCFDVVTWEETITLLQQYDKGKLILDAKNGYKDAIIEIGKQLDADSVLIGFVKKYSERIGTSYGADRPASVSFTMLLFSTKDASIIWVGAYSETQVPLFDNLLNFGMFIRRWGKWLTADELAKWGVREALKTFPGVE